MITVTFSTGQSATYSGNRKVAAAYLVTLPSGYTYTGFSASPDAARKTGRSYATVQCPHTDNMARQSWLAEIKIEIVTLN